MTILEQIIETKKSLLRDKKDIRSLEAFPFYKRQCVSLTARLNDKNSTGIIAEFKRRSPSKGVINDTVLLADVVNAYQFNDAAAISVLTDEEYFGGSNDDLIQARQTIDIPLLRKDFIIDEYQLVEAKTIGADVILLIAACLKPREVKHLARFAGNLGLEVLLELHDEEELDHVCDEVHMIGINNRNLKTFQVDIANSLKMAMKLPADKIKIAESGIKTVDDVVMFREQGFKGFLIGEYFMKQADPTIAFAEFVNQLKAKAE